MARVPEPQAFSGALRQALQASGRSLAQVVEELGRRGVSTTTATLSTWQTGRTVPTRRGSQAVVAELERVLGLAEGELQALAGYAVAPGDPPAPQLHPPASPVRRWVEEVRSGWGHPSPDGLERELVVARVTMTARRRRRYTYQYDLRATVEGVDRLVITVRRQTFSATLPVPGLTAVSGCTIGRVATRDVGGVTRVVEVLLPYPLARGQAWRLELATEGEEDNDTDRHEVQAVPGVGLTVAQVVFAAEDPPDEVRRVHGHVADGRVVVDRTDPWAPRAGTSASAALTSAQAGRAVAVEWRRTGQDGFKT